MKSPPPSYSAYLYLISLKGSSVIEINIDIKNSKIPSIIKILKGLMKSTMAKYLSIQSLKLIKIKHNKLAKRAKMNLL